MAKGRPTKLTNEAIETAKAYVSELDTMIPTSLLPTVERLAIKLDVHRDTLYEWAKIPGRNEGEALKVYNARVRLNVAFSDIFTRLLAVQSDKLLQNSLIGRYNPVISKLMLSKHGYVDTQKVDQNNSGEQKIIVETRRYTPDEVSQESAGDVGVN